MELVFIKVPVRKLSEKRLCFLIPEQLLRKGPKFGRSHSYYTILPNCRKDLHLQGGIFLIPHLKKLPDYPAFFHIDPPFSGLLLYKAGFIPAQAA